MGTMRIDLSRLHWPQVVMLGIVWVSALGAAVTFTVTDSWGKIPTPVWGLLGSLLAGGTASSFLGSVVKPADRSSAEPPPMPTTRPRTVRGDVPAVSDEDGGA